MSKFETKRQGGFIKISTRIKLIEYTIQKLKIHEGASAALWFRLFTAFTDYLITDNILLS